jgi:hypothetical protein
MDQVRKITQAYSLTPWRQQIQRAGTFFALLVLGVVIAIIYVEVSAETATMGREIQDTQRKIETAQQSIADKQAELAKITSAVDMERRAIELGFQPIVPGDAEYLHVTEYGGRPEAVIAPTTKPAPIKTIVLAPEYSLSLIDWVRQQLYLPAMP